MRTSSQLTKVEQCEFHPRANITQSSDHITRALAQKNVLLRMLREEPIEDIQGEIDNLLISKKCTFENNVQKRQNLFIYKNRINRYLDFERCRMSQEGVQLIFPDNMDKTVDFFGEIIKAQPDYFVRENGITRVVKIKTSRVPKNKSEDIQKYESYALGLLGKKLFPNDRIIVEFNHLGDIDGKTERMAMTKPYEDVNKTQELLFDEAAEQYFQQKHSQELELGSGCGPDDCAGCSMNNICHFEEPPISIDVMKEVKPISEIRLTNAQQRVIDYEQGVARINAGAGAGKTLVVAMRIVELLKKGYQPEDICLLTFTNAGAEEMTARVVQYCSGYGIEVDPGKLTSTTFNAFCQNILNVHYEELGYSAPPRVLPEESRSGIINRILDQYPRIEEWNYSNSSAGKYNAWAKTALNAAKYLFAEIKKEGYTRENNPYEHQYSPVSLDLIFQMYNEFEFTLKMRNMVEYDDQLIKVFELLKVHPTLFEEIGYKHIIVDEFQDTDLPQIRLLNQIMDTTSFKSFMAVGDDSQSIFAFRHTSPEYMIHFDEYFGRFDDFNLVENHRSAGDIIDFANKVNALNENRVEKDLIATKADGIGPQINGFYSQKSEYEWVAKQIIEDIENGKNPSDIAFLASDRTELTKMASILTEAGVPSILMNPVPYNQNSRVAALTTFYESFFEGSTRGLLDYKNVLMHGALKGANAQEMEALAEEFSEEIHNGDITLNRFLEYARALDEEKLDECYQSFMEKVEACQNTMELSEFFRDFKLYGNDSRFKREGKYEGVCLTTVHSAKGLEWDVTYLSLSKFDNEKYHTLANRFRTNSSKEETNRKWFVGATRAREKLVMTGEYVVKFTQRDLVLNDYVKQAYDLLGKAYGYASGMYWETKEREKQESLENSISKLAPNLNKIRAKLEEKIQTDPNAKPKGHDVRDVYRVHHKDNKEEQFQSTQTQELITQHITEFEDAEIEFA